ncbi:sensor histidine kinase [Tindallia californiensis]|uniref:histidine kinase n=1 Tax=Tindallia californiensis TaxID=159292 RepID=A0A1H3P785_9FIRM|nr:sensor histidine kinase [Tindallia californiensis]SDY96976.1 Signal transduction histidine kinase [Tindallia californiensis]
MTLYAYMKDKALFLMVNFLLFLVLTMIMIIGGLNPQLILLLFVLWFLPLTSHMLLEAIKLKRYYDQIQTALQELDSTYLLPEVMEKSTFITGQILNDILGVLCRDMHEEVKNHRDKQQGYREYIEGWVHEIKTPIASSKLIIENQRNPTTEKIEGQLKKIEGYVQQALYYARSNTVREDYLIKAFPLKSLLVSALKNNSKDFIAKKITIDMKEVDYIVYSDYKWVEFIVQQILINAINYSKENRGRLEIFCEERPNALILMIKDFGIGINERDINRVFDKGFTGENGRRLGSATGMGLYLSKKLCLQLGLSLEIISKPMEGTTVMLGFPLDKKRTEVLLEFNQPNNRT